MSGALHKHRHSITLAYKSLVSNLLRSGVITEPLPLKPWVVGSIAVFLRIHVPPHPVLEARYEAT